MRVIIKTVGGHMDWRHRETRVQQINAVVCLRQGGRERERTVTPKCRIVVENQLGTGVTPAGDRRYTSWGQGRHLLVTEDQPCSYRDSKTPPLLARSPGPED